MSEPLLRIAALVPPPPSRAHKVRQVLWGLLHVVHDDPKPAIYVVNQAGYARLLFRIDDPAETDERLDRVGRELDELGIEAWCERYRVPREFVEALDAPKSKTRFRPIL